jgi:hypothetical protein
MGDFPKDWEWVRDLSAGGQGHTFVVRRSDRSNPKEYVLKRLINPKREDYFDREILACRSLDHRRPLEYERNGRDATVARLRLLWKCPVFSVGPDLGQAWR